MKKLSLVLAVVFLMVSVSFALTIKDVVDEDIYTSEGIQATMKTKIKTPKRDMEYESAYYMKDKKTRTEMQVKPEMVGGKAKFQRLKMMGMTNRVTINIDKGKTMEKYMIFPNNNAYVKQTSSNKKSGGIEDMLNQKIKKVGEEKFHNATAMKYKVVNPEKFKSRHVYVKDGLIIGTIMEYKKDSKPDTMTIYYENVKKGVKDSKFDVPKDYQSFSNMRAMMQQLMQNMQK